MERPRRRARRQASKRLAPFYRMTFLILIGAIAARLIILGIDALGARTGLPGGEIFIPVYIIIAPLFGWQLRGWTAIGGHQRRKETRPCTTISATTAERPSTPEKFATASSSRRRASGAAPEGWHFDGGEVKFNIEANRIQIIFDGKPDEDTRSELKSEAFKWAPSQGVWQRQLTDNAIRALKRIKSIQPTAEAQPSTPVPLYPEKE